MEHRRDLLQHDPHAFRKPYAGMDQSMICTIMMRDVKPHVVGHARGQVERGPQGLGEELAFVAVIGKQADRSQRVKG